MESRCHESAVATAVVGPDASHRHHLVIQIIGILHIRSGRRLLVVARQIVVVQRETRREVMMLREVGFKQQLRIGVLLVHAVVLLAVVSLQQVHRGVTHQGDVRTLLGVDDEGVLHIALIAVGLYTYLI